MCKLNGGNYGCRMVAIQVQVRTVIGSNNEDYYTACTDYNGARIHATCIALVCYRVDYSISITK